MTDPRIRNTTTTGTGYRASRKVQVGDLGSGVQWYDFGPMSTKVPQAKLNALAIQAYNAGNVRDGRADVKLNPFTGATGGSEQIQISAMGPVRVKAAPGIVANAEEFGKRRVKPAELEAILPQVTVNAPPPLPVDDASDAETPGQYGGSDAVEGGTTTTGPTGVKGGAGSAGVPGQQAQTPGASGSTILLVGGLALAGVLAITALKK